MAASAVLRASFSRASKLLPLLLLLLVPVLLLPLLPLLLLLLLLPLALVQLEADPLFSFGDNDDDDDSGAFFHCDQSEVSSLACQKLAKSSPLVGSRTVPRS